jgi:uncharacterized protein (TIGR02596 family)
MPALRSPSFGCARAAARRGFTLIELLLVLLILAILAALTVPGLQGTLSSMNLRGSANLLYSELDLGRQIASARNLAVDLRMYQDSSGNKDSNGNYPFRMMALVISSTSSGAAADEFVGPPMSLQGDVIIDSSTQFSSLLNTSLLPSQPPPTAVEASTAPSILRGKTYVRFMFLPNGTLNLASTDSGGNPIAWTLTVINQQGKKATIAGTPAANYITLLLDVATGRARTYQP